MPDLTNEIIKKTLAGVSRAQRDYKQVSGGCDLWEAPEYMITTSIAKTVSVLRDSSIYVTLENNVRGTIDDAGGIGVGRPPKILSSGLTRFDIILWHDATPIGVVEVKRNPSGFSSVKTDVARICAALTRNKELQFGLVAYYRSSGEGNRTSARDRVVRKTGALNEKVNNFVTEKGLQFAAYCSRVKILRYEGEYVDIAWVAMVLAISR